jgi:hypothetical protein
MIETANIAASGVEAGALTNGPGAAMLKLPKAEDAQAFASMMAGSPALAEANVAGQASNTQQANRVQQQLSAQFKNAQTFANMTAGAPVLAQGNAAGHASNTEQANRVKQQFSAQYKSRGVTAGTPVEVQMSFGAAQSGAAPSYPMVQKLVSYSRNFSERYASVNQRLEDILSTLERPFFGRSLWEVTEHSARVQVQLTNANLAINQVSTELQMNLGLVGAVNNFSNHLLNRQS